MNEKTMRRLPDRKLKSSQHEGDYGRKRSLTWLFVTLVAIVAAGLAGGVYYEVANNAATGHGELTAPTVIATQRIPAETAILPSMFKVMPVPTLYRPPDAAGSPALVEGRIASTVIPDGVIITIGVLSDSGAPPSLAGQVNKGEVGFFLPESVLIEPLPLGLVNRGDNVDVYVAGLPPASAAPNQAANPVIRCVPILGWEDAGQPVPQNVISTTGSGSTSTAGFIMMMPPDQVSAILSFVQNGNKFGLVVDRYDACKGK